MFFIGINAEIEKLSDDMHLVAGLRRDICNFPNGAPWDFDFSMGPHGRPMQSSAHGTVLRRGT
jgi:hypothetical protein